MVSHVVSISWPARAAAEFMFLLNPDTRLEKGCLEALAGSGAFGSADRHL